jgi:hypothetical protein
MVFSVKESGCNVQVLKGQRWKYGSSLLEALESKEFNGTEHIRVSMKEINFNNMVVGWWFGPAYKDVWKYLKNQDAR